MIDYDTRTALEFAEAKIAALLNASAIAEAKITAALTLADRWEAASRIGNLRTVPTGCVLEACSSDLRSVLKRGAA